MIAEIAQKALREVGNLDRKGLVPGSDSLAKIGRWVDETVLRPDYPTVLHQGVFTAAEVVPLTGIGILIDGYIKQGLIEPEAQKMAGLFILGGISMLAIGLTRIALSGPAALERDKVKGISHKH